MILGAMFLGLKFRFEWYHDYMDGIVPGVSWTLPWSGCARRCSCSCASTFFMTGLHALHMVVGIGILTVLMIMTARNKFSPQYYAPLEISGLVLALRRYCLDFPVPASVFDRRAIPRELIAHV